MQIFICNVLSDIGIGALKCAKKSSAIFRCRIESKNMVMARIF